MTLQFQDFANGRFVIVPKTPCRVEATRSIANEDWKTALAHKQRRIEIGEQGALLDVVQNFYGVFDSTTLISMSIRAFQV